jgi:hypothetical protein
MTSAISRACSAFAATGSSSSDTDLMSLIIRTFCGEPSSGALRLSKSRPNQLILHSIDALKLRERLGLGVRAR